MRNRIVKPALAICLSAMLVISGCSFGSVMNGIAKWLPVGEQALAEILAILSAGGALTAPQSAQYQAIAAKVSSDFGDIQSAVNQYNAAPSTGKSTTLAKVITAMQIIQTDLSTFESDARIVDAKDQTVINLSVGALLTTLAALEAQISPSPSIRTTAVNAPRTPAAFKKSFNQIMTNNGYPQYVIH